MQTFSSNLHSPKNCSRTSVNTKSVWTSFQVASSSRLVVYPSLHKSLSASSREDVTAAAFATPTAARCSRAVLCLALPSSASNTENFPGPWPLQSRNETVPYRWSWQDDTEQAAALELDPSAVAAANSLPDLTALLQTAIAAASPRAALTPVSRSLLNEAVQRMLQASGPATASSGSLVFSVSDAAQFLEAYGTVSFHIAALRPANGTAASAPHGDDSATSDSVLSEKISAPPLLTCLLAHLCTPLKQDGTSSSQATAVEMAPAKELADLLWAISELQEDLPWDECTMPSSTSTSSSYNGSQKARAAGNTAAQAVVTASASASESGQLGLTQGPTTAAAAASGVTAAYAGVETMAVSEAPAALQRAVEARLRDQDCLAPDLCRVVCALGSLSTSGALTTPAIAATIITQTAASSAGTVPHPGEGEGAVPAEVTGGSQNGGFQLRLELLRALEEEIRYQLTEFDADFEAADLGRLISGMAALRLGPAVAGDGEYHRILMKAVYGKTRSLTDKAAVDFALSKLLSDDPEARSMHYDSRWTHEELRWLPRRERDKRRIIKEGWYRTKWGGWSPGGEAQ